LRTGGPDAVKKLLRQKGVSVENQEDSQSGRWHGGHAWIIDPCAHLLEVLQLDAGRWVISAAYAGTKVVRAEPFAEIPLDLGLLWVGQAGEAASSRPAAGRRRRAPGPGKPAVAASRTGSARQPRRR
jgi:hypothetical protein